MKSPKEYDNLELLELVCQLHFRSLQYPSKEMNDAYVEARTELTIRLKQSPLVDYQKQREVYIPCDEETDLNIVEHKNWESYGEFVCHVKKATTPIVDGYSEDYLRAAISAGLSIGYSPNYKLENREQEIQNILSSLTQSTSITK